MNLLDFGYRIWHKKKRKYYEFDSDQVCLSYDFDKNQPCVTIYGRPLYAYDVEIELWSGYVDSSLTKIYENDIIEVITENKDYEFKGYLSQVVRDENRGGFYFIRLGNGLKETYKHIKENSHSTRVSSSLNAQKVIDSVKDEINGLAKEIL